MSIPAPNQLIVAAYHADGTISFNPFRDNTFWRYGALKGRRITRLYVAGIMSREQVLELGRLLESNAGIFTVGGVAAASQMGYPLFIQKGQQVQVIAEINNPTDVIAFNQHAAHLSELPNASYQSWAPKLGYQ